MIVGVMFGVLLTILNKKKVTRRYLAEKYEVSERTIQRYIDSMCEAGVPIYSLKGVNGGYCISDEYQFDSTYFTKPELQRLITSLNALPEKDDQLTKSLTDKVLYLAKRKSDSQYLIGTDSLIIDAGPWNNPTLYRTKMQTIQKAIDNCVSLNMIYIDRYDARTYRLFDPYCRILKEGVWYVFGYCHYRKAFRLFKLARIQSLVETEQTFTRQDCDVYAHLDGDFDDVETVNLEIEFSSTILTDIEEWLGYDAVFERGYKYIAKANMYGGKLLVSKLLSFGSSIKILSPQSLRDEVIKECKRILVNADEL